MYALCMGDELYAPLMWYCLEHQRFCVYAGCAVNANCQPKGFMVLRRYHGPDD